MEWLPHITQALTALAIGFCLGSIHTLHKRIDLLNRQIETLDGRIDAVYDHLEQFYDE